MKNAILLFISLLSVISICAQKKIPEPQRSSYRISSHSPNGNGYILSNINFTSKVVLTQPQRDKYVWQADIYEKSGRTNVEGYVYNGKRYSSNELINDFNIGLSKPYIKVKVIFNNGKSFTGWSTSGQQYDYVKNDENTSFGIRSISIVGNPRNTGIEASIKRGLRIKEDKKRFEEERLKKEAEAKRIEEERLQKLEEERLRKEAEAKRIEEERLKKEAETNKTKEKERLIELDKIKEDIKKQQKEKERIKKEEFEFQKKMMEKKLKYEKEQREKEAKEDADYYAGRRRTKKALEEENKKKMNQSRRNLEKSLGDAFSLGLSSLFEGGGYLKLGYGIRNMGENISNKNPINASTLEVGAGYGKLGLFVGYSLLYGYDDLNEFIDRPTSQDLRSAIGGTWVFGLDFTIYKFDFLNMD